MFNHFYNQEERKAFGGTAFLELQYCKMKKGTPAKTIVSVSSINHWQEGSIYVHIDDIEDFIAGYGNIFKNGLYNNMNHGEIDPCGINYYSPSQVIEIINAIEMQKPSANNLLRDWLKKASEYNGVYILGV